MPAWRARQVNEALLMFSAMVLAIAIGVPIPMAVAIGTVFGYYLIDIPFVALAQAMYTGVEPFPLLTRPVVRLRGLADGARRLGGADRRHRPGPDRQLHRKSRPGRSPRMHVLRRPLGVRPGDHRGDRRGDDPRDDQEPLRPGVRRCDRGLRRRAGKPDPAEQPHGHLRDRVRQLDSPAVPRRHHPGDPRKRPADAVHVGHREAPRLPGRAESVLVAAARRGAVGRQVGDRGAGADSRRNLLRRVHPDGSGVGRRDLRLVRGAPCPSRSSISAGSSPA